MTPERWAQIKEVFGAAFELRQAERSSFLDSACDDDAELRAEVEHLLEEGDATLHSPASGVLNAAAEPELGGMVGPYRIESKLGEGGMGVVYRATDTRLGRNIALKFVKAQFAQRSEREARAVAALNHPNICTLHDVGPDYLVMELVEGDTLAERLKKGRMPMAVVLQYGAQIADALAAAHARRIIHRDLKPANIMITKSGVKVLDFGLARIHAQPGETLTGSYAVMGTPAYMSPQQREGKEADAQTDIYSFGLVLYEMATGERAFEAVDLRTLQPLSLERVVKTCLKRDPEERWHSASDLKRQLEWIGSEAGEAVSIPAGRARLLWWIAAGAVLAVTGWFGGMRMWRQAGSAPGDVSFTILPPAGKHLSPVGSFDGDRISPDGSMILFSTTERLYVRRLSSLEGEILPDVDWFGAPFWAPDSQSIAFPSDGGRLMKMRIPKGAPEVVAEDKRLVHERGGSWGEKGIILVAHGNSGLFSVPAAGGTPQPIRVPGLKEGGYYNPEFLPGGQDFLFEFAASDLEGAQVYIATLRDDIAVNLQLLLDNETAAAFTPAGGGRILYVRNDNLYSQKLDRKARKLVGDPELLQERVATFVGPRNAYFSVSRTGTLVWREGTTMVSQATAFDRTGKRTGIAGTPAPVISIRLSPDESRLIALGEAGLWIVEANGPGQVRINLGTGAVPFWSPDSERLIFTRGRKLMERPVSDSGQTSQLAEMVGSMTLLKGVSPDGRRVLYGDGAALYAFALDSKGVPERIFGKRADNAAMSPDGKWAVYNPNDEDGVYVQRLSGNGLPRQIAKDGTFAVWRADGKEILLYDGLNILSVRVEGTGETLQFAEPKKLFSVAAPMEAAVASGARPLAVNRDGSRIYFLQSPVQPDAGVIKVRTGAIR